MINILFIHQSSEMYGSDKTLLLLLKNIDKSLFFPVVILPNEGILKSELEKENIKVVVSPVLKLYRKMFEPKNLIKFFLDLKNSFKTIDKLNAVYKFEIIYSNTLAVLLGFFYAKRRKIKHLWHVHEIIESPKIFKNAFVKLLSANSNTNIVYNSIATQKFWNLNLKIANKSKVIWNGLELNADSIQENEIVEIRKNLFKAKPDDIIIALVGRISRWKGQMILLNAMKILSNKHKNIKLAIVGAPPPNQEIFLQNLVDKIQELELQEYVKIIPFQDKIFKVWAAIDIAVVPSIEPEPFGLVAVEAMLAKKPVVASNHGGLTEIIINNETGFLVEPNNEIELADALNKLIENKELRNSFGENGHNRAIDVFSAEAYVKNFESTMQTLIQ